MRRALTVLLVLVWGVNGLWCKVLGQVPRHEQIVTRVVGEALAPALTILIGLAELGMVVWILSGLFPRMGAHTQAAIVMTMNVIEQVIAGDLLLFGRFNLLWATVFSALVLLRYRLGVAPVASSGATEPSRAAVEAAPETRR